jgi:hypothetical protein
MFNSNSKSSINKNSFSKVNGASPRTHVPTKVKLKNGDISPKNVVMNGNDLENKI